MGIRCLTIMYLALSLWLAGPVALGQASRPAAERAAKPAAGSSLADRIGSAHVAGAYNFTQKDFLNEGADEILKTGMRVIKVYLLDPAHHYPFNSKWPKFQSMVQAAQHPYYRELFAKPFTTYMMTAYSYFNGNSGYWRTGMSDADYAQEEREFCALAKYLMQTYRGTGKTFVLQHWEGDWMIRNSTSREPEKDPSDAAINGMARWLNARQDGVTRARREIPDSNVKVYHACEVNLVALAMNGRPMMVNEVVPKTHCDLYSYSAYDTIGVASGDLNEGRRLFRRALDHIASKAPDSPAFGSKNVYVGEFGWPEVRSKQDETASTEKCLQVLRMTVSEALDWGCPYVVYWQVYDNEPRVRNRRPENGDVRGWYLIKPDGTHAAAWDFFASLLKETR